MVTARKLDKLLRPASVALIGASEGVGSLGRILLENLARSFAGPIYPVNPRHLEVCGRRAYRDCASMPEVPDLAIVATPAATVPAIVGELADRGCGAALIVSAGFEGEAGRAQREALLSAVQGRDLRIVGPNTLGMIVPRIGLNASFAHVVPLAGGIALLAQSGAIATSVLDRAVARDIGFSCVVSLGDMLDVDFGDLLLHFANDPQTTAILLYVEAIARPVEFLEGARAAARAKPVVVLKGGRLAQSAQAAASHTGRLAGPDAEYSAAFRSAGLARVATFDEFCDAAETLEFGRVPSGRRVAIVSNGGGLGVLAADALLEQGGELAVLGETTIEQLNRLLPAAWSRTNPVDIVGDAGPQRFKRALDLVLEDGGVDGVLVLHCPTAVSPGPAAAAAVAESVALHPGATVLTSWPGEQTVREARALLRAARVPTYDSPEQAARGFMQLYQQSERRAASLAPAPANRPARDRSGAGAVFERAHAEGREWLTQLEARTVLAAYGIATAALVEAATPFAAGAAAETLGGSVALKVSSPDVVHKSEAGGVALNLVGAAAVERAATQMQERVTAANPSALLRGFTVEPMFDRGTGLELIVGAKTDGDFGPIVLFGEGGTAVEAVADTALELPPVDMARARRMIGRTRIHARMAGYRNVPAVDVDAVADVIVKIAELLADFPEIREIDVNPLLATGVGCTALDARIRSRRVDLDASAGALRPGRGLPRAAPRRARVC